MMKFSTNNMTIFVGGPISSILRELKLALTFYVEVAPKRKLYEFFYNILVFRQAAIELKYVIFRFFHHIILKIV